MEIPEGWPTDEMTQAGFAALPGGFNNIGYAALRNVFKAMCECAPTPPAQEDEPWMWFDGEVLVSNEEVQRNKLNQYSWMTPLYTRPANDELRRAAVALTEYCSGPMKPEIGRMIALTDNLRAVLRENYGTSSRIQ